MKIELVVKLRDLPTKIGKSGEKGEGYVARAVGIVCRPTC